MSRFDSWARHAYGGKVVVVTGAGSGIGAATVRALARSGATLHLVDIDLDRVESIREEVSIRGCDATSHIMDCASAEAMNELAEEVFRRHGRVDLLQNGVGILVAAPVEEVTLEDWKRAIDANLWSVVHGVHAFVPRMLRQGGRARLVNIASVEGLVGFPYTSPYSATKFAVVGLSESLSGELYGKGITVTAVCPGMVRSNLIADGILRLPGRWRQRFDWSYKHLAPGPDRLARRILRAAERGEGLVVPSAGFAQVWRAKRAAAGLYDDATRRVFAALVKLG